MYAGAAGWRPCIIQPLTWRRAGVWERRRRRKHKDSILQFGSAHTISRHRRGSGSVARSLIPRCISDVMRSLSLDRERVDPRRPFDSQRRGLISPDIWKQPQVSRRAVGRLATAEPPRVLGPFIQVRRQQMLPNRHLNLSQSASSSRATDGRSFLHCRGLRDESRSWCNKKRSAFRPLSPTKPEGADLISISSLFLF